MAEKLSTKDFEWDPNGVLKITNPELAKALIDFVGITDPITDPMDLLCSAVPPSPPWPFEVVVAPTGTTSQVLIRRDWNRIKKPTV